MPIRASDNQLPQFRMHVKVNAFMMRRNFKTSTMTFEILKKSLQTLIIITQTKDIDRH